MSKHEIFIMGRTKKYTEEELIERKKESCKKWYWNHKEFKNEKCKEWYSNNTQRRSEYNKKWREENKEYDRKRRKEYANTPMGRAVSLCSKYKGEDKKHGRGEGDLTPIWILENIFSKPCRHCGKEGWDIVGCNRLDNSKPHTMDNVEPCCEECNKKEWFKEQRIAVDQISPTDGEIVKTWETASIAKNFGYSRSCIQRCCRGERKMYKGYIWKYVP